MKSTIGVVATVLGLLVLGAVRPAAGQLVRPTWSLKLGPEEPVDIGRLHNAPNGHISYADNRGALTLWVAGRLPSGQSGGKGTQGTFLLHPRSWSTPDLESAAPALVFAAPHNDDPCDAPDGFYRNYAAINSVIPGPRPGELLAFVDGEYHPNPGAPGGIPLLASIGLATSTDGVHWSMKGQIIQGLDASIKGCRAVAASMKQRSDNEGAAGPSAVIRDDGGAKYIYLYYADRIRLTQAGAPTTYLYVARSLYSAGGAPGTWQKWTGSGWSATGDQQHAAPVVTTPKGAGESAHPEVSYNSLLHRSLIVFHTKQDLYAASSRDGTSWDAPQALSAATAGARKPSFPTLVTEAEQDQQMTGASGWLFYSRNEGTSYIGYRRTFTILPAVARAGSPRCHTPQQCCRADGGTWSGGRCL